MSAWSISLSIDAKLERDLLAFRVQRPASQIDQGDQRYRGHFLERSKRPVLVLFLQPLQGLLQIVKPAKQLFWFLSMMRVQGEGLRLYKRSWCSGSMAADPDERRA
jgi:hypothetical protein